MNDYMQYSGASLYGNYRQRTFSEIFYNMDIGLPTVENFKTAWEESPFSSAVNEGELNLDLILLYVAFSVIITENTNNTRSMMPSKLEYISFILSIQFSPYLSNYITNGHNIFIFYLKCSTNNNLAKLFMSSLIAFFINFTVAFKSSIYI